MSNSIIISRLKKQPSSLYNTCVRYVARNLKRYKHEYLGMLPPMIKNAIIVNVTRVQRGFHNDELLEMLTNRALTRINLSSSTITNRTLISLAEKCPKLNSLTLSKGEYRFTLVGLEAVARNLLQLQQISVKNCPFVNDALIELLAQNCPRLDLMDFEACPNVTDRSAESIKRLKLTKLNLSRTNISDVFLKAIAEEQCGRTLEDLNVGHCKVTGSGLVRLPWDTIKYIGFEGCDIEDLEFIEMSKNLKYIQWTISN
ncbi:F-box/LRR-repeat protein 2-like [Topomyia yanbarensis]|uniref:F-box/LRR-repeat protein 2-like n=1 Tax=Topomyia yanbarensis TaxID=2498891 RepID=UPI00273BD349|nr:F-box/LRR-repeat protein 2-like [Topomyia yanbarensis]